MNIFLNLKIKTIYLQRKINKKISEEKHSSSAFRKTVNKVFHFINKIAQDARKTILLSKILYAYIAYRWKTLSMQFNSKKATRKMMLFRDYILLKWDYIKDNLYLSATGLYYLSVILRKLVFSNIDVFSVWWQLTFITVLRTRSSQCLPTRNSYHSKLQREQTWRAIFAA